MSKIMELADVYAQHRYVNGAEGRGPHEKEVRTEFARAALVAEVEKLEAEKTRLQQRLTQLKRVDALGEAMFNVQLRTELSDLEAENAKLRKALSEITTHAVSMMKAQSIARAALGEKHD